MNLMKRHIGMCILIVAFINAPMANTLSVKDSLLKLNNPVDADYLKSRLQQQSPRLFMNHRIDRHLKKQMQTDALLQNVYRAIQLSATELMDKPLLIRKKEGIRLLDVSREMLYRMNVLCMVYRIDQNKQVLERINKEVLAVCNFSDWNPSHYLDVAEMSLAVAIAVDWAGEALPDSTLKMAKQALIEKGIAPSFVNRSKHHWLKGSNNWNQVCHGGLVAAAIAVADDAPELAAKTINRALEGIPYALAQYGPDGVYPEGSTYWYYGTTYTALTSSMLSSAFGTDFGIADYPGLKESATFRAMCNAPSGMYFNYADCWDVRSKNGDFTLAWFANQTGNSLFFERERFMLDPTQMDELTRHAGVGLIWLSQVQPKTKKAVLPMAWKGNGVNPIVIFTGGADDKYGYYLGAKGGSGSVSHGNMDAGSFVFELNGVRWVVDPGNQDYYPLEKAGFNLWANCQDCERWNLLTKNNFGHSTLTVNNQRHNVQGTAEIIEFNSGSQPKAVINLTPTFKGQLGHVERTFTKDSPVSLIIDDRFKLEEATEMITWQLITTAEVDIEQGGATLSLGHEKLKLEVLSHPKAQLSVVSLYPAPLELDRQIEGLKRLEIRMPAWIFKDGQGHISVRLSDDALQLN